MNKLYSTYVRTFVRTWFNHICIRIFIHVCGSKFYCCIDPPAITAIEVTEVCTNDFTVSWTAASNGEGLSYSVTLFPSGMAGGITPDSMMSTSYNFTDLMPNTAHEVSVATILNSTCLGIANTTMVTTLTVEAGLPQSELLIVVNISHSKTPLV